MLSRTIVHYDRVQVVRLHAKVLKRRVNLLLQLNDPLLNSSLFAV
jgi:hypothetical protein